MAVNLVKATDSFAYCGTSLRKNTNWISATVSQRDELTTSPTGSEAKKNTCAGVKDSMSAVAVRMAVCAPTSSTPVVTFVMRTRASIVTLGEFWLVGMGVGTGEGCTVGWQEGCPVGEVGCVVGWHDGLLDGCLDGCPLGL